MSRCLPLVPLVSSLAVTLALFGLRPSEAAACGGFVCSQTPPPDTAPDTFTPGTPVNQSGESVIYAREPDGTLVMTVQIRYEGNTGDFAWILPVPVVPELAVGSDAAFDALRQRTEPEFQMGSVVNEGSCPEVPDCEPEEIFEPRPSPDRSPDPGPTQDASVAFGDMAAGGEFEDPVMVHSSGQVGPYETAVIGSSDASLVIEWLNDAGFGVPEDAHAPLQAYADQGHVFVALRMATDTSTNLIQPLTLRMATEEVACLPLRLTRIASVPDMPITLYFLGDAQVVPRNYSMVRVPIDERPDLFTGAVRWSGEVGSIVDTVGGQGFVTEYAGGTPPLVTALPSIEDLADATDLRAFVQELVARGFDRTTTLLPTLQAHIEPPEGMTTLDYLNCLARAAFDGACGLPVSFDTAAIVAQLTAAEVEPRLAFDALVARHGYLTRMSTAMDPEEMTVDPLFEVDPDMPAVSNIHTADRIRRCSEDYYEDQAPIDLVIGERSHRLSSGLTVRAQRGRCNPVPPILVERSERDGCSVSAGRGPTAGLLLLAGLLFAIRRRR